MKLITDPARGDRYKAFCLIELIQPLSNCLEVEAWRYLKAQAIDRFTIF
jgi:hypothetical protein